MARNIFFMFFINMLIIGVLMFVAKLIGIDQFAAGQSNPYMGLFIMCLFWGMGGAFISLFMSKWMAKSMMGVQIIDPNTHGEMGQLVQKVHMMAKGAGLSKMPEVGVYNSPEVNAFATGPSKNNSLVAVSTGLLHNLREDEVDGVLAHEVAHVANGDMVTMTIIQGIVNAFVMFFARIAAMIVSSALSKGDNEEGGGLGFFAEYAIYIVFQIAFGFLALPVVMWFSRWREYRADAGGARLAGREKMIAALERLKSTTELIDTSQQQMATLKISDKQGWARWFSSHPPLEDRIQALRTAKI